VRIGEAVPVAGGADAGRAGGAEGISVCGKVARPAAASPVGRYSGPLCPQPASAPTTLAARASRAAWALTRIWKTFDMVKL
jgi:hypothetical protein